MEGCPVKYKDEKNTNRIDPFYNGFDLFGSFFGISLPCTTKDEFLVTWVAFGHPEVTAHLEQPCARVSLDGARVESCILRLRDMMFLKWFFLKPKNTVKMI